MPDYSTLVRLELIGQVLSFKCNNVKTRQKNFFICTLVSFVCRVHVQCFGGVAALELAELIPRTGAQGGDALTRPSEGTAGALVRESVSSLVDCVLMLVKVPRWRVRCFGELLLQFLV